ncbi:Germin-like protein subfamily 3 member 3 [Linum grandiflorum]
METQLLQLLTLTTILLFTTQSAHASDFCVADLTSPETPSGFPCKNPQNVTVDDFVFTGFTGPLSTANPNKLSLNRAFVKSFPALNGLNLAAVRVDMERDGSVPLHSHPYSAEMIFIVEGTVTAGFVAGLDSNKVYIKKLNKGEMMVFPQGFLHFQANSGPGNATIFVNFNNADPGVQFLTAALFRNDFPTLLLEKTTGISQAEIRKLKSMLGGSG